MSCKRLILFFLVFSTNVFAIEKCSKGFLNFSDGQVSNLSSQSTGLIFEAEIRHPKYYLWDNWGFIDEDGTRHIYALSASKEYSVRKRHLHVHWRHFVSRNNGRSWKDKGIVLNARKGTSYYDNQSIWSGSVIKLESGEYLAAYTALNSKRTFLQSISLAISKDAHNFERLNLKEPLMDHETLREQFLTKNYYVDEVEHLGAYEGEANGSIQSLRDAYLLEIENIVHIFWAAKAFDKNKNVVTAIGHAKIADIRRPNTLKILAPIIPPDGDLYTQLELPNIIQREDGSFVWYVSTTNRTSEDDPENEIDMDTRRYVSETIGSKLKIEGDTSTIFTQKEVGSYGLNILRNYQGNDLIGRVFNVEELYLPADFDFYEL